VFLCAQVVAEAEALTEQNLSKIEAARKQMQLQTESGIGICATMGIIVTVTLLLITTYIFMKVFPK
jgi:hypothetical protein